MSSVSIDECFILTFFVLKLFELSHLLHENQYDDSHKTCRKVTVRLVIRTFSDGNLDMDVFRRIQKCYEDNCKGRAASSQESLFPHSYETFKQRNNSETNDFFDMVFGTKSVSS